LRPSRGGNLSFDWQKLQTTMKPDVFKRSIARSKPPTGLAPALQALWWAGKDDWERAHDIVMAHADRDCAWVHAYLHRREGDLSNARWWYKEAHRPVATASSDAEWRAIVGALLSED
jgi:hypothetical protein